MQTFDVIVIGAGSAGLGCSGVANTLGLKTLLIEKNEAYFGGDCTNFGCVPSKALIHIAHQFYGARQARRFGLQTEGRADMKKILDYIHEKQANIRDGEDAAALRKKGITVVIGEAAFHSENSVEVNGEVYGAKIIFLCSGSSPRILDIEGIDQVQLYTNENIFYECKTLPEHLLVIGGGPIGCELGQAFSRLGSRVTLVNKSKRILNKEPEKVSEILQQQFRKEGIQVINRATVNAFSEGQVKIEKENGERVSLPCQAALMAVGRVIKTEGLQLEKADIELTEKGHIKINEYLQTTNNNVYLVGDVAGSYQFSHGAEKMVRQVWRNLIIPVFKKKNTLNDLSWVTFTDPQVAHFGLTEEQLNEQGTSYYRQDQDMGEDDRAIIEEYGYGRLSVWFGKDSWTTGGKKLLSGSMIAPRAGELIQELQLAKHAGVPVKKINNRVYPYPVAARINQKLTRGLMQKTFTNWKLKLVRTAFHLFH